LNFLELPGPTPYRDGHLEAGVADLTTRAINIIKSPQTEWPVIAAEPTDFGTLFKTYVIPLAAIGPVCSLIGGMLIGTITPFGTYRTPLVAGLVGAVLGYGAALLGVFISTVVIEWLAPKFKSIGTRTDALKMVAYASTPGWVAGVLNLVPLLWLLAILAMLYGIYVFYLGLPHVMKTPPDQVIAYMVVAALVIIVVYFVLAAIVATITASMLVGGAMMTM
jgi:hypothetical protein